MTENVISLATYKLRPSVLMVIFTTLLCTFCVFFVHRSRPVFWVSTETLSRVLTSCQAVLEGGSRPVSDQNYFQSAFQATIRILDSVLYLTCKKRTVTV